MAVHETNAQTLRKDSERSDAPERLDGQTLRKDSERSDAPERLDGQTLRKDSERSDAPERPDGRLPVLVAALVAALVALTGGEPAAFAAAPGESAGLDEGEHAVEDRQGNAGEHAGEHTTGHGDPSANFNWTDLDYKSKDAEGGTLDPGEEPMSPPFVLMLVNFAIVLFIVGWKMAPPIQKFTRDRHHSIKQALEEAALLRQEAQKKLDELNAQARKAEAEVAGMIAEMRQSAEAEKERIVKDAEAQAAAMEREVESRIAADLARARAEIEREVVAAAVAAAEKLVREQATAADQARLVETFISDMKETRATPAAGKEHV